MRCSRLMLAALALSLLPAPIFLYADTTTPDFSGSWQMNAAKSQINDGRVIKLVIKDDSGKIDLVRTVRERDGKEMKQKFTCSTGGSECEFDENGHKCKVSLWYDGPALVILKTDGPHEDSVTQWRLQLSADNKNLDVQRTQMEPVDKTEKLVFDKMSQ